MVSSLYLRIQSKLIKSFLSRKSLHCKNHQAFEPNVSRSLIKFSTLKVNNLSPFLVCFEWWFFGSTTWNTRSITYTCLTETNFFFFLWHYSNSELGSELKKNPFPMFFKINHQPKQGNYHLSIVDIYTHPRLIALELVSPILRHTNFGWKLVGPDNVVN